MKFYETTIGRYFFLLSFCSIALAGFILEGMAARTVNSVKRQDTKEYLSMVANEAEYIYRRLDPDDIGFYIDNDTLFIGTTPITEDYTIIDHIKAFSNTEITFFCEDRRAITTILDANGERFINTTAIEVWNHHAVFSRLYFSEKVKINGVRYFGYYKPLKTNTNEIVGMVFAGVPAETIEMTISEMQSRILIACLLICALALIATIIATGRYLRKQTILMSYLSEIDKENFDHEMPKKLTSRKDEFGVLSRHIEKLNDSLKLLVQFDGLTMLYNRRTSVHLLQEFFCKANETDAGTFTFAIGDIDFFKQINDTYGHACGDEVLKQLARILERNMKGEGFAGRWGGEEFVLVFNGKIDETRPKLENILNEIRNTSVTHEDKTVKITMTFGLSEYMAPAKIDDLISVADRLLYEGKKNGRNQIVG